MKKRNKKNIDYKAIFIFGAILISIGGAFLAVFKNGAGAAFIGLGVLFMLIGMSNKDKWKKRKTKKNLGFGS